MLTAFSCFVAIGSFVHTGLAPELDVFTELLTILSAFDTVLAPGGNYFLIGLSSFRCC